MRDWAHASHLVLQHIDYEDVPTRIRESLTKSIVNRRVVANHYALERVRTERYLSEADLDHLSFIDILCNIRRHWFPPIPKEKQETSQESEKKPATSNTAPITKEACQNETKIVPAKEKLPPTPLKVNVSATATSTSSIFPLFESWKKIFGWQESKDTMQPEEKPALTPWHNFNPKAFANPIPGKFIFEIFTKRQLVSIWHPYHATPVHWNSLRDLGDVKWELRRYLRKRWPVGVLITDSIGCWELPRPDMFHFAFNNKLVAFDFYDRLTQDPKTMFPAIPFDHGVDSVVWSELISTVGRNDEARLQLLRSPRGGLDPDLARSFDFEIFLDEQVWISLISNFAPGCSFIIAGLGGEYPFLSIIAYPGGPEAFVGAFLPSDLGFMVQLLRYRGQQILVRLETGEERSLSSEDVAKLKRNED